MPQAILNSPQEQLRALTKKWERDQKACCRPGEFKCSACHQQHKDMIELEKLLKQLFAKPAAPQGE